MEGNDEQFLMEYEVASRLGVSSRMVRKYYKKHGLPFVGTGRRRKFRWLAVLEWYLLYRVEIIGNGGHQKATLAEKLSEIRNEAETAAVKECSEKHRRQVERLKMVHAEEIKKLTSPKRKRVRRSPGRPRSQGAGFR